MIPTTEPRLAYERALVRPWRFAFLAFFIAMTIGTHWPRLSLAPEIPATDKTIHFFAFAALTVLLWRTRWLPGAAVVALALLDAVLDEVTQGIPGLGRTVTGYDITANILGVLTAFTWILALRPTGGEINRRRLRTENHAFDRVFLQRGAWAWLITSGALVVLIIIIVIWSRIPGGRFLVLAAIVAAMLYDVIDVFVAWQRERRHIGHEQLCLDCGHACRHATLDEEGRGSCPTCGAPVHRGQWAYVATRPEPEQRIRRVWRTWMVGVAGLAVVIALIMFVTPLVYAALLKTNWSSNATQFIRTIGSLPDPLTRTVDLAVVLGVFALLTWRSRRGIAREYDQSLECRRCGHDLHATPIIGGVGRCGECGNPFLRESNRGTEAMTEPDRA